MTGDVIKKEDMLYADKTDIEVAHMVRMLMRNELAHEAVCCAARDRIMYLSQQNEVKQAIIDNYNLDMLMDVFKREMEKQVTAAFLDGRKNGLGEAANAVISCYWHGKCLGVTQSNFEEIAGVINKIAESV